MNARGAALNMWSHALQIIHSSLGTLRGGFFSLRFWNFLRGLIQNINLLCVVVSSVAIGITFYVLRFPLRLTHFA